MTLWINGVFICYFGCVFVDLNFREFLDLFLFRLVTEHGK